MAASFVASERKRIMFMEQSGDWSVYIVLYIDDLGCPERVSIIVAIFGYYHFRRLSSRELQKNRIGYKETYEGNLQRTSGWSARSC